MTCQYCESPGKRRLFLAWLNGEALYICVWDFLNVSLYAPER